ncbi:MAG: hypothetical protein CMF39_05520 [Legionellaceae bacterium]|mgnify:FL=1|nr:hypothetical protein [Legionellaceae bacterium]|tara:strand:- start:101 stop:931 length:831 start_codon:yes stop_codon:yes gene_type:complete
MPALAQDPSVPDYQSLTSEEAIAGCDRYASHPDDPMKPESVPGVASDADVAHDAAYVYCLRAFGLNQNNPRLAFQNGRVNHARNPYGTGQPLQMFTIAYRGGSEIAGSYLKKLYPEETRKMFIQGSQTPSPSTGTQRSGSGQPSTLSGFFDGVVTKINQQEASYESLVLRINCCADFKEGPKTKYQSIRDKIDDLNRRREQSGKWSCDRIEFIKYDFDSLGTWIQLLSRSTEESKHAGSISSQDKISLDALVDDVRQTATLIQERAIQTGCDNLKD